MVLHVTNVLKVGICKIHIVMNVCMVVNIVGMIIHVTYVMKVSICKMNIVLNV